MDIDSVFDHKGLSSDININISNINDNINSLNNNINNISYSTSNGVSFNRHDNDIDKIFNKNVSTDNNNNNIDNNNIIVNNFNSNNKLKSESMQTTKSETSAQFNKENTVEIMSQEDHQTANCSEILNNFSTPTALNNNSNDNTSHDNSFLENMPTLQNSTSDKNKNGIKNDKSIETKSNKSSEKKNNSSSSSGISSSGGGGGGGSSHCRSSTTSSTHVTNSVKDPTSMPPLNVSESSVTSHCLKYSHSAANSCETNLFKMGVTGVNNRNKNDEDAASFSNNNNNNNNFTKSNVNTNINDIGDEDVKLSSGLTNQRNSKAGASSSSTSAASSSSSPSTSSCVSSSTSLPPPSTSSFLTSVGSTLSASTIASSSSALPSAAAATTSQEGSFSSFNDLITQLTKSEEQTNKNDLIKSRDNLNLKQALKSYIAAEDFFQTDNVASAHQSNANDIQQFRRDETAGLCDLQSFNYKYNRNYNVNNNNNVLAPSYNSFFGNKMFSSTNNKTSADDNLRDDDDDEAGGHAHDNKQKNIQTNNGDKTNINASRIAKNVIKYNNSGESQSNDSGSRPDYQSVPFNNYSHYNTNISNNGNINNCNLDNASNTKCSTFMSSGDAKVNNCRNQQDNSNKGHYDDSSDTSKDRECSTFNRSTAECSEPAERKQSIEHVQQNRGKEFSNPSQSAVCQDANVPALQTAVFNDANDNEEEEEEEDDSNWKYVDDCISCARTTMTCDWKKSYGDALKSSKITKTESKPPVPWLIRSMTESNIYKNKDICPQNVNRRKKSTPQKAAFHLQSQLDADGTHSKSSSAHSMQSEANEFAFPQTCTKTSPSSAPPSTPVSNATKSETRSSSTATLPKSSKRTVESTSSPLHSWLNSRGSTQRQEFNQMDSNWLNAYYTNLFFSSLPLMSSHAVNPFFLPPFLPFSQYFNNSYNFLPKFPQASIPITPTSLSSSKTNSPLNKFGSPDMLSSKIDAPPLLKDGLLSGGISRTPEENYQFSMLPPFWFGNNNGEATLDKEANKLSNTLATKRKHALGNDFADSNVVGSSSNALDLSKSNNGSSSNSKKSKKISQSQMSKQNSNDPSYHGLFNQQSSSKLFSNQSYNYMKQNSSDFKKPGKPVYASSSKSDDAGSNMIMNGNFSSKPSFCQGLFPNNSDLSPHRNQSERFPGTESSWLSSDFLLQPPLFSAPRFLKWSVQELAEYVASLDGCAETARALKNNGISGSQLPYLTLDHMTQNLGLNMASAQSLMTIVRNLLSISFPPDVGM